MNEKNLSPDVEGNPEKKPSFIRRFIRKHPLFTAIICGLMAVILMYFAKEVEGNWQRKAVVKAASEKLMENDETMLKLLCKPLVWSIRSEMLRGNMEQVNLLISDLVKGKNFLYIHLVDANGKVLLSTNKKMEEQPIDNGKIEHAMLADSVVLMREDNRVITVVAPVMGFDRQLSSLVLSYRSEDFSSDLLQKK